MLLELAIADFAIIDELRIEFEPGMNALTGETGAGKSIIIDALGAVLGERVSADEVRTGARLARVEATFEVLGLIERMDVAATFEELGVEPEDGLLILGREIGANGRSSARVNGRTVTASVLSRLGSLLVDIHGQSDHLTLLRPGEHLEILDRYAGLGAERAEIAGLVQELRGLRRRIGAIQAGARERAQRVDLLRFQVGEVEAAGLQRGEEDELLAERQVLANAERLAVAAATAYGLIHGDDELVENATMPVMSALQEARGQLDEIAGLDASMRETAERLAELVVLLEDVNAEVRSYRDTVEADPARLEAVEERLELLKSLKRKYGARVEEVIEFAAAAQRELDELTGGEAGVEGLQQQEAELLREIGRRATALSAARREAGARLAREVEEAIAELNMGRSRFAVEVVQIAADDGAPFVGEDGNERRVTVEPTGADRVQFLIATNVGEALKPLGRVASGGETARLMLALKSVLSRADQTPTLVFDEVDVGVGGRSGQVVGEKLWGLGEGHQVLVITHLPQIAAFADAHFQIAKSERDGRVVSQVAALGPEDRVEELAAMIDGQPVTAASRANAEEMMTRVSGWKGDHQRPAVAD